MFHIVYLLIIFSFAVHAQSITYQELLNSATKHSIKLKIFKSDEDIESSKVNSLYEKYYPTLSLSYNTEYNKDLDESSSATESFGDSIVISGTKYKSSLSLNLNHELYNFGTTEDSIEIAKKEVQIKKFTWCDEEIKLHQSILDTYSSAIKSKTKQNIKEKILQVHKKLFEVKQRLYKAGKYSKIDLGDEAITILDIEKELDMLELQYQEEILNLSKLSYIKLDAENTKLMDIGVINTDNLVYSFENSASWYKYDQKLQQKVQELDMLNHSLYPTLTMYGNYYMYGSDEHNAYDSYDNIKKNSWKIGLAVRFNIFEGFKYSNTSQRLKYELLRIKQEKKLYQREYEYTSKIKQTKISNLNNLTDIENKLYLKTHEKMDMVNRLREALQIDSVSELKTFIQTLQRELNLELQENEVVYEKASLDILHKGLAQCTQH